jgi:DNA ligase (NAD+)
MGLKDISDMRRQNAKLTLVDYSMISEKVTFSEFKERWPSILEKLENLPYPMDGLVIKFADEAYSESLGSTAHHPRGQIAFKFSGVRKTTKLLNVEWSFGKNCLTPVAELEPVEIGGITIRHATLHNAQNIIDKDIKIGDIVTVERAGDVNPLRCKCNARRNPQGIHHRKMPVLRRKTYLRQAELRCPNPDCSRQGFSDSWLL